MNINKAQVHNMANAYLNGFNDINSKNDKKTLIGMAKVASYILSAGIFPLIAKIVAMATAPKKSFNPSGPSGFRQVNVTRAPRVNDNQRPSRRAIEVEFDSSEDSSIEEQSQSFAQMMAHMKGPRNIQGPRNLQASQYASSGSSSDDESTEEFDVAGSESSRASELNGAASSSSEPSASPVVLSSMPNTPEAMAAMEAAGYTGKVIRPASNPATPVGKARAKVNARKAEQAKAATKTKTPKFNEKKVRTRNAHNKRRDNWLAKKAKAAEKAAANV